MFWMFFCINMLFYIIFGTNLLTQSLVTVFVFSLFFSFAEKEYQTESKRNKTFTMIFLGLEDIHGTWRPSQKSPEGSTSPQGTPWLVAPRESIDLPLSSINSQIFPNDKKRPQKYFSAATSLCSCEIPSWGLFRHPAGGGFDHGGHLHQLYLPSDEA